MFKKRTPVVVDPDGLKAANEELLRKVDRITNQLDESRRELESSRYSRGLAMEAVRSKHELELAEKDMEVKKKLSDKEIEVQQQLAEMQIAVDRINLDMKEKFMRHARELDSFISEAKVSQMQVMEQANVVSMLEDQLRTANANLKIAYEALAEGCGRPTVGTPRRGSR